MNRTAHTILLALLSCIFLGRAGGAEVAGVSIPDSLSLPGSGTELYLNGAGIRSKFLFDIYVGALYLPEQTADPASIISDDRAAAVLMHFLYRKVERKKITDGWNDGMKANLPAQEFRSLQPRLEQFNSLFTDVGKGDRVTLSYLPGTGTEVRVNDKPQGTVAGNDFFRALLQVWLGSEPASRDLKHAMLGGK